MIGRILFLCTFVLFGGCKQDNSRHYETVGTLAETQWHFSESAIAVDIESKYDTFFGDVSNLAVLSNGDFVLHDRILGKVWILPDLFSSGTSNALALSTDDCGPGISLRASDVMSFEDSLFVYNNGPWGLVFSSKGSCLEVLPDYYLPDQHMVFEPGDITGVSYRYGENKVRRYNEDFSVAEEHFFEQKYPLLASRYWGGGVVKPNSNEVCLLTIGEPVIRCVNIYSGNLSEYQLDLPQYNPVLEDIRPDLTPEALGKDIQRVTASKSIFLSFHHLSLDYFIVQFGNPDPPNARLIHTYVVKLSDGIARVVSRLRIPDQIALVTDSLIISKHYSSDNPVKLLSYEYE